MFTKWVRQIKDKVLFSSKKAPTFPFKTPTHFRLKGERKVY